MNPLRLLVLLVSLPLLLGGCGEKEPVAEVKPKLEGVNQDELEPRGEFPNLIYFIKGSDSPYTGKVFTLFENGTKVYEGNYKDGKQNGLAVWWWDNGQKLSEVNYKNGKKEGLHVMWHANGQKSDEGNMKDGKKEGLYLRWHANGQKKAERNWKDGKKGFSAKYWNSKGEPVDTWKEAGLK